jgi:hypothetical protein
MGWDGAPEEGEALGEGEQMNQAGDEQWRVPHGVPGMAD